MNWPLYRKLAARVHRKRMSRHHLRYQCILFTYQVRKTNLILISIDHHHQRCLRSTVFILRTSHPSSPTQSVVNPAIIKTKPHILLFQTASLNSIGPTSKTTAHSPQSAPAESPSAPAAPSCKSGRRGGLLLRRRLKRRRRCWGWRGRRGVRWRRAPIR